MKNIGYINLELALKNGEFKEYLVSNHKYRTLSVQGADIMNDFFDITYSLNEFGSTHPGFDKFINDKMIEILKENKIFFTYSIANIVKEQINLQLNKKNKIDFIDENLLINLKQAIINQKEELSQKFNYEGAFYNNGLMGVYESIDKEVYNNIGHHII